MPTSDAEPKAIDLSRMDEPETAELFRRGRTNAELYTPYAETIKTLHVQNLVSLDGAAERQQFTQSRLSSMRAQAHLSFITKLGLSAAPMVTVLMDLKQRPVTGAFNAEIHSEIGRLLSDLGQLRNDNRRSLDTFNEALDLSQKCRQYENIFREIASFLLSANV